MGCRSLNADNIQQGACLFLNEKPLYEDKGARAADLQSNNAASLVVMRSPRMDRYF